MHSQEYLYDYETYNHALNPNHICRWPIINIVSANQNVEYPAANEIWYTTIDNQVFNFQEVMEDDSSFNIPNNVKSNTYINGKGIVVFDNPITALGIDIDNNNVYPTFADIHDLGSTTLTSIILPTGLTTIYYYAFPWNTHLTTLVIPEGVTTIGEAVFEGNGFTSISLPSTLIYLDTAVFNQCSNLSVIQYNGTISEWISIDKNTNWKSAMDSTPYIQCLDGKCNLDGVSI